MTNDEPIGYDKTELLQQENDRLKKRLEYIRKANHKWLAMNFALNAPDEEIDALELEEKE